MDRKLLLRACPSLMRFVHGVSAVVVSSRIPSTWMNGRSCVFWIITHTYSPSLMSSKLMKKFILSLNTARVVNSLTPSSAKVPNDHPFAEEDTQKDKLLASPTKYCGHCWIFTVLVLYIVISSLKISFSSTTMNLTFKSNLPTSEWQGCSLLTLVVLTASPLRPLQVSNTTQMLHLKSVAMEPAGLLLTFFLLASPYTLCCAVSLPFSAMAQLNSLMLIGGTFLMKPSLLSGPWSTRIHHAGSLFALP
mmetsp:Transcript_11179/g.32223  ORF Transcript_11179/g.32223 Transcript_11179/m.32223 type:complete len:248 (+) Transcript_11179:125-868(+)